MLPLRSAPPDSRMARLLSPLLSTAPSEDNIQ